MFIHSLEQGNQQSPQGAFISFRALLFFLHSAFLILHSAFLKFSVWVSSYFILFVAEAYMTQPNRKAGSRVLYVYLACMAGWPLEQRDAYVRAYVSPHACAVMPWGGRLLNSSLAWDGAVMMPLHFLLYCRKFFFHDQNYDISHTHTHILKKRKHHDGFAQKWYT